jgi:YggT family protein
MGWLLLYYLLELLKWLVIVRALASWLVDPRSRHPAMEILRRLTDPVLRPIAAALPAMGGIDLSPLLAFFVIHLVQSFVVQLAAAV